jgi:RHS repeat-associated protein
VDGGQTATYVYNALNQRVRATVGGAATEYVFNASGQRVSEWNGTTRAQLKGKYYWGGKPVAYYANGSTHFEHQDWLGTERLRTAYNGGVEGTYISQPWGDGFSTLAGVDADANHYATLDHDAESGTDHAEFRQYSEAMGRWLSPDPYDGSYDGSNPQSFNRYVYAGNNPLAATDSSGMTANPKYNCAQNGDPTICAINAVQEVNTGGGGGGCTMDGMYAPCSMVYSALQSGAAVQCPDNVCSIYFYANTEGEFEKNYFVSTGHWAPDTSSDVSGAQTWVPGSGLLSEDERLFNNDFSWYLNPTPIAPFQMASNNDSGMAYDIFHCPSCVNTWKQSNCVVSQPWINAATAVVVGAPAAAIQSGTNNVNGSFLEGAWTAFKEGTASAGAAAAFYGTGIFLTAKYMVMGCPQ